jgi:single-stranded-DNA-specific exonuclease
VREPSATVRSASEPFLGVASSVTGRAWRSRLADDAAARHVAQRFGVPDIVARVLAARGVDPDADPHYLEPTIRNLMPDPSSFRDMDVAAERIADAVAGGEPIAVFGDYDVDGATSTALLVRFLRHAGADVRFYIPDRIREGYGPNAAALVQLAGDGVRVVVTVDCGTTAYDALAAGRGAGLDVVVVDHHEAEPELPVAHAIVNPNRLDEGGACHELAAVGVAFLLAVAVNRVLRTRGWYAGRAEGEPDLLGWLDLVALGTVCDSVPLTGLNRAFVAQGLRVVASRRNIGIAALADVARVQETPGTFHAGFMIGPRVNAGGRVGRSDLGARLLTTEDPGEAAALAAELDTLNAERRTIEALVLEQALARTAEAGDDGAALVVWHDGWHPGVIGIVASRLVERVHRPVFVVAVDGGVGKGSGRSVRGIDIGAAVIAARQAGLLVNGGGHAMAAGLTVAADRLPELRDFLAAHCARQGAGGAGAPSLGIDAALAVSAASADLIDLLGRAGPYGSGNAEPRFAVPAARIVRADVVGTDHVRCILAGGDGGRLKGIAFRSAGQPLGAALVGAVGRSLHLAGHLRPDNWQGRRDAQLVIEDAADPR